MEVEKKLKYIYYSFVIKTLNKLEIERKFLNLIKYIYKKKKPQLRPYFLIVKEWLIATRQEKFFKGIQIGIKKYNSIGRWHCLVYRYSLRNSQNNY